MRAFTSLNAIAAPLLRDNIDTDMIIRIERLVGTNTRGTLGKWCFAMMRYRADGSENPDFILNKKLYRQAEIVIAGRNFGCGSSREGAVWALQDMGINCVIAPSFGDIFFNNCFQIGVLPVILAETDVKSIADEVTATQGNGRLVVSLVDCIVTSPSGQMYPFAVEARRRQALIAGLDEVGVTLQLADEIAAFQARDSLLRPWIHQIGERA
ncbi:3-isopropylmalate dehydratase small subunit [Acidisphaera sp. L21]|uniref:3-isopropylmalate dehydratase small subunit n=1 Tax=Acidisphaera sp. L21 TaxID=1641851 RepID=UPI00131AC2C2|nr:3-isopropylmalate dehydratase small subunit [Acidisphaera sp. L21]